MFVPFGADETKRVVFQYKDAIARIALHYCKNWADAEDITQEVILKWVQKMPRFETQDHEKAWFIRVTINLCKDKKRSAYFRNTVLTDTNTLRQRETQKEKHPDNELLELVFSLPEKYSIVVYLHYYEQYSLKEIAKMLNKNPNTIQTWNERAKKSLKAQLGEEVYEYGFLSTSP